MLPQTQILGNAKRPGLGSRNIHKILLQNDSFLARPATVRAIPPHRETLLAAAAFPAVFINIGHGENGFLTAALLGAALYWLDFRPWLAGLLSGLLAYKPQFGVLLKAAALASASLRATPYVMDYDLVVVASRWRFSRVTD